MIGRLTLFARHATEKYSSDSYHVIDGDATKADDLKAALQDQDIVYCAVSGEDLPIVAKNLVFALNNSGTKLFFMGAIGIYNEIPDAIDGKDNVENNPDQIPNREAVDIIEASNLNYTIFRPGYLREGSPDDFVLTPKGESAKGYITTIPSVIQLFLKIVNEPNLYNNQSVGITKDMTQ